MRFGKLFCYVIIAGTVMYSLSTIIEKTEKNMQYSPELQEAWDVINGLQSLFLSDTYTGASTEPEILELGEKVLKIRDAFAFNDDRIEVLRDDQAYFEGEVRNYLTTLFPLANNIDQAIEGLKQPAAFITAYNDYVATVPTLLATSLSVSISDLPDTSDAFWEDVFEITKDAREIRARLRGNDWLEDFEKDLCITGTPNMPAGTVHTIRFERDQNQNVAYTTIEVMPATCHPVNGDAYSYQVACIKNQIQEQLTSELCEHGCEAGVCLPEPELDFCSVADCEYGCENGACLPEPDVPVTLSHFELYKEQEIMTVAINDDPDRTEEYRFDLVVVATNSDGSVANDYDGQGLIIVTGDGEAEFSQQVNLTLDLGVGRFPIVLTKLDDVSISYKDVGNKINGNELVNALPIYKEAPQPICPAVFMPVCATTQNADGEKIWKTYSSQCDAEQRGAQVVFEEACSVGENIKENWGNSRKYYGYDRNGRETTLTCCDHTNPENMCAVASCAMPEQGYFDWKSACTDAGYELVGGNCHCESRLCTGKVVTQENTAPETTDPELQAKYDTLNSIIDRIDAGENLVDLVGSLTEFEQSVLREAFDGTLFGNSAPIYSFDFTSLQSNSLGGNDTADRWNNIDPDNKQQLWDEFKKYYSEDADGDGVTKLSDYCDNDPNKVDIGECGCGTPDDDSDGDGTVDCKDECPDDPDNRCNEPCYPDSDSDGDGVCDAEDSCPSDPDNKCIDPCYDNGGDSDGDGTCDDADMCPDDPTDSCDDWVCEGYGGDTDNDSICDEYDVCPDDPADLCDENFPELFGDEDCSEEDRYYGYC